MIIGMRGHDFGRMSPDALTVRIREAGFRAAQLAFTKAFDKPAAEYMNDQALLDIRQAFEQSDIAIPVMGCYVSASDKDPLKRSEAKKGFTEALKASVILGAGCVGTETTHFTFPEEERTEAYARLLDFTRSAAAEAENCDAIAGIEPVALHTLNTPEMTAQLLQDVNSPALKIILDLANLVTPATADPAAQMELLHRSLASFGDRICVLHVKDGVFNSEGVWENRPLGQGIMNWSKMLPVLRRHNDSLCALREGVWPGMAEEECRIMHRWAEG